MRTLAQTRQPHLDSRLRVALFTVVGLLALLVCGAGTAMAEEEGSSGPIDPIVVPEVEVPTTGNQTATPTETTSSNSGSSSPAPASKPTETVTSTGTTTTKHTSAPVSSGGSKTAPTQANHGITNSGGSTNSGGNSSPSGGNNGGGETTSAAPTGSTPSVTTTSPDRLSEDPESATTTAAGAGFAAAGKAKAHSQPAAQPDQAPETGALSDADAVSKPDKHAPFWAPLGGKNSLPYVLVILAIVVIGLAILFIQFGNPQRVSYWRARLFGLPEASIPVQPKKLRPAAKGARPRRLRTAERNTKPSTLSPSAQRRKAA